MRSAIASLADLDRLQSFEPQRLDDIYAVTSCLCIAGFVNYFV